MSVKIAFISQTRLSRLLNNLQNEAAWKVDFEVHDWLAEQKQNEIKALDKRRDIEVFLAGGGNAAVIESLALKTPLVKIQPSGFDIMQALWQAQHLGEKAVFVNYGAAIPHLEKYKSIFSMAVEQVVFKNNHHALETLLAVLQDKNSVIIGASLICDLAASMHAKSVFIYSQASVKQAIIAAQQLAHSIRIEREKREKLEAILHSVQDGIIYIDSKMQIEEFNPAAEAILNIPATQVLGKSIKQMIPSSGLEEVVLSQRSQHNQLQNIGEINILTNRLAVFNQGKLIGAVASFQDTQSVREAERTLRLDAHKKGLIAKSSLTNIIGESPQIKKMVTKAKYFAKTDATILIQGKTGTGKELLAQGIHLASLRSTGPFVAINCAAIPEFLLESELFGYAPGAFTGAKKQGKTGLFELANKGTIFLDEIGELPLSLQGRLLRVLQEKEIMRVGAEAVLPIDVRIIAATNRDLQQMVADKNFKEDLYYRINVLHLNIPPLRQRVEDIPLFIDHFLRQHKADCNKHKDLLTRICPLFIHYAWPGNIRELENIIERLAIMLHAGIAIKDIEEEIKLSLGLENIRNENMVLDLERQQLLATLKSCGNNKSLAAERLGISRSTLWRKLSSAQ